MCVGRYGISGKFVGINYALLPNREWNKKQKHKKTALEQSGMLRIWRRDYQISQTILHGRDATLRVRDK